MTGLDERCPCCGGYLPAIDLLRNIRAADGVDETPTRPIALIGMWLLLMPQMLLVLVWLLNGIDTLESPDPKSRDGIVFQTLAFLIIAGLMGLYFTMTLKTTIHYLRQRSARRARPQPPRDRRRGFEVIRPIQSPRREG